MRSGFILKTEPSAGGASSHRVAEDDGAVAVEREVRDRGGREGRHDEPAALLVAQDDVGGAGLVLDRVGGAGGGGATEGAALGPGLGGRWARRRRRYRPRRSIARAEREQKGRRTAWLVWTWAGDAILPGAVPAAVASERVTRG